MRSGSSGGALGAPSSPGFARTVSQTELGGVGGSGSSLSSLGEDAGRAGVPSRVPKRRGAGSEGAPAFRGRLAFLALASLFALAWLWFVHRAAAPSYVVVIDAGSQGSRVHVYTLDVPAIGMPSARGEARVLRVKPGLSAFADDPIAAGASLEPLLEHAASFVPADALASTPALLYATAGLRSVPTDRAERVLASCRETLRRSPFRFRERDAMILPGEREGLYAWVAANYAAGTLGAAPANTVGVLELGGASMQITFRPERKPPEAFRVELLAARRKWSVYTHSALGLGQETARAAHLDAIAAKRRPSNVGEGEGGGEGRSEADRGGDGGGDGGGDAAEGGRRRVATTPSTRIRARRGTRRFFLFRPTIGHGRGRFAAAGTSPRAGNRSRGSSASARRARIRGAALGARFFRRCGGRSWRRKISTTRLRSSSAPRRPEPPPSPTWRPRARRTAARTSRRSGIGTRTRTTRRWRSTASPRPSSWRRCGTRWGWGRGSRAFRSRR